MNLSLLPVILLIIGGIFLLYFGAEMLVRNSVSLSFKFRVQPLLVGLLVIGFGTSSPELFVSIGAAFSGSGEIAVGNIIGSNISNIALVLGVGALIYPIATQKSLLKIELPVLIAASLLLTFLILNGHLSRWNGLLMLAGLAAYLYITIRNNSSPVFGEPKAVETHAKTSILVFRILAGLALLIAGAEMMIYGATKLAVSFQLSEAVIGLTVVAIGTSLPELATAAVAGIKKEGDLIIGAIIGSNILNILFVLGFTVLIRPIQITGITPTDLIVMTSLAVIVIPIIRTGYIVNRLEGAFLLLVYSGYITWLFMR